MNEHEKNMRKRENKEFIWRMIKGVALSCVIALVIYFAETIVLADILEDAGNLLPMILMQIAYLIAIYGFYIRHEAREFYSPEGRAGNAKAILMDYIRREGWLLALVYGVVAVLAEAARLIAPHAIGNPLVFIGMLNMPLSAAIGIPILRMVIGYAVTMAGIFALTVLARKKVR